MQLWDIVGFYNYATKWTILEKPRGSSIYVDLSSIILDAKNSRS